MAFGEFDWIERALGGGSGEYVWIGAEFKKFFDGCPENFRRL